MEQTPRRVTAYYVEATRQRDTLSVESRSLRDSTAIVRRRHEYVRLNEAKKMELSNYFFRLVWLPHYRNGDFGADRDILLSMWPKMR
jgi:hypothetical protein